MRLFNRKPKIYKLAPIQLTVPKGKHTVNVELHQEGKLVTTFITVSHTQRYKQCGNGIIAPMVTEVITALLNEGCLTPER